jgi:hypothetical protein
LENQSKDFNKSGVRINWSSTTEIVFEIVLVSGIEMGLIEVGAINEPSLDLLLLGPTYALVVGVLLWSTSSSP